MSSPILAVDFDGTIVEHAFPHIGNPVPGAIEWLKAFQKAGCRLILLTMRGNRDSYSDLNKDKAPLTDVQRNDLDFLTPAVEYCRNQGIEFWAVNDNPEQNWTTSRKVYANIYIDDAAAGCPLMPSSEPGRPPFVDWDMVGPLVMSRLGLSFTKRSQP